jgi:phosphoserine aminotransferase
MARIHNFSAGPAVLPLSVLEATREALLDLDGTGIGLAEMSHRSKPFEAIVADAKARLHRLLRLSDDQDVLFLHGGGNTQFFMVPMNLLRGGSAVYLDTGVWANKAVKEAQRFGTVHVPFSSKATGWDHVPAQGGWGEVDPSSVYFHYTSNNTVAGSEFAYVPEVPAGVALVCDASSNILSRDVDGSRFDLIYAGAQKNLGPSGVTVVVIRRSLLERCDPNLPTMLRYGVHAENGSLYNTPCTIGIYMIREMCRWIDDQGGVAALEARNQARADRLYTLIDGSSRFRALVRPGSRSNMNVTFTTGDADLDLKVVKAAEKVGISGIKGHRSVGGLRASMYNALPDDAVDAIVAFLSDVDAAG